jgi:hypothetical protein
MSIASPLTRPSPNGRRVGIRIVTFEACSGFTHLTARQIAQPPKAAFVTRLQPFRLPGRAARQLPDQSTTLWVESSSTDDSRLRGALPLPDLNTLPIPSIRRYCPPVRSGSRMVAPAPCVEVQSDRPICPGGCSWRKITSRRGPWSARHPAMRRSKVGRTPGPTPGCRQQISSKIATSRMPGAVSSDVSPY